MSKIDTGFEHNKYQGATPTSSQLARYFSISRFNDFLRNRGFWFSRVYRWKEGDPCESTLLPAFRKNILDTHKDNRAALAYMLGNLEFQLKANFGCCFCEHTEIEYDNMWRLYAPKPHYGVMLIVDAIAIQDSLSLALSSGKASHHRFAKVDYISDDEANLMHLSKCKHVSSQNGQTYWDPRESHFYKRKSYAAEKEVRAILSQSISIDHFWEPFLIGAGISKDSINAEKPKYGEETVRIYASYHHPYTDKSHSVLLTLEQAIRFQNFIEQRMGELFKLPLLNGTIPETGIYIPFELSRINKIVLHPNLDTTNDFFLETKQLIENLGLANTLTQSDLYNRGW